MKRSFILVLVVAVFLNACASAGKADRKREGDNKGQETQMTPQDEVKMTQEVLPQMQKDYPALNNPGLQKYISDLGKKLVKASDLEGKPYHYSFAVVDVDYVNAFALPAGTIYVTAPLIAMAENEAELAGVIGHEIGHVIARHTAERMEKAKKEQTGNILTAAGMGILTGIGGYALGSKLCKPEDKMCLAKATLAGAAVGAGGTLLVQKYFFMKNGREDEMEADRIGFRIATKAGYDKNAVGTFYEKLLQMEKASKKGNDNAAMKFVADAMSTHPPSDERVAQMKQMASESSLGKGTVDTKIFDASKKEVQSYIASKKK